MQKVAKKQRGCIVFTSSAAAAIASPFTALYAATKSFISSFGASLAVEVKHHGIDVLVFHPSPVNTRYAICCLYSLSSYRALIRCREQYMHGFRTAKSHDNGVQPDIRLEDGALSRWCLCRFYDKAHKLDVLDFFKARAVHPDELPNAVFR